MLFKKIRLLVLIGKAFIYKEKKIILLSLCLGISLFFLLNKIFPYIPRPKKTDRVGLIGNFTFEDLPNSILYQASSGLTRISPNGTALPSLVERWSVDENGKNYIFWLANNIFWQDGTAVEAQDIKIDLPDVKTKILNNKMISFELHEPFSPFPTLLATPVFKENFLGTGKYEIRGIEKNGNFIKKLTLASPDKNIIYSFYPTQQIAFKAFKLGEIDFLIGLSSNPFENQWKQSIEFNKRIVKDQYLGLFLNLRDKNLANKNLRQALAYATQKPDDQTRAIGPIQPNSWAFNQEVKLYEQDSAQAKKLFVKFKDEAGIDKLKLRIDTTSNFLLEAQEIANSWKTILGIETEIRLIDKINPDFSALLILSQISQDPDQYSFWHSTQETNIIGYKSPKIDKILEDARRLQDKNERRDKYLDFQRFLLEDCPVIFISYPEVYDIKRKKIFT